MEKPSQNQTALAMQRYYQRAFDQIAGQIAAAQRSDSYWKVARRAHLLQQIGEILDRFTERAGGQLDKALRATAEYQTKLSLDELKEFMESAKHARSWHLEYNRKQVAQACADAYEHIAGQTNRMKQQIKTRLRDEAAEVFRLAAVSGTSRAKAYRELRDSLLTKNPNFQFIDRAGRSWDSKTYLDMMTHTVMSQAQNDTIANTYANEGVDLVKVNQNGAKDACRKWEGRILSLTGATKGYPTLAEAKATNEVFHPRCRHRVTAYDPDIDKLMRQSK